ncbi:MAG: DEAD/DEAH box helicase family protein [Planctomycetia bacterium]|nr:DEAD/DEAH box helicase family protein [Planctomycetia bacterium]
MFALRPYQRQAVDALYDYLRTHDDNPVIVAPTGSGKSALIAAVCTDAVQKWQGRVLVLAHVRELLEQNAEKIRRMCPELPVGIYSAGLKRRDTRAPVLVAGIQSIYRRAGELDPFDLVLVDECFPAGTPIVTPFGSIGIDELRVGDVVETALGLGRILATSVRTVTELVHIEVSDGTRISCTPGHRVFTPRGWIEASSLAVGEILFSRDSVRALWCRISSVEKSPSGRERLCLPREAVDQTEILLDLLREEACQSHEPQRRSAESAREVAADAIQAASTWRKRWAPDVATIGLVTRSRRRMGGRSCLTYGQAAEIRLPDQLQSRPCESRSKDRDRDRWKESSIDRSSGAGCQKRPTLAVARVVSVSREQCTSPRTVFNLHVDRHPSYFAGGILVHNCHLIPPEGEGMYRQFLAEAKQVSPHMRVIGLTATPFRLKSGMICSPDHFLNAVCHEIGVRELIRDGYLCPLISKAGRSRADTSRIAVRAGEFAAAELESVMDQDELVRAACREIVAHSADRQACLIFASGVQHGRHVCRVLQEEHGIECGFVCGETPDAERDELLARFRGMSTSLFGQAPLRYLCNVNVLTTGFDAPQIDCIALLRPTMSPGLFVQMVGRGFRLHSGKRTCLVLDFGGNVERHGPVDQVRVKDPALPGHGPPPAKECPECRSLIATGYARCPDCGYEFPPPEKQPHEAKATNAGILSGQVTESEFEVRDVTYRVHTKQGASPDAPKTMRVTYQLGLSYWVSEFICFEHEGWARKKAQQWWKARSPDPVPETVEQAVDIANAGGVATVETVTVRSVAGEKFDRIIAVQLGPMPEALESQPAPRWDADVPF